MIRPLLGVSASRRLFLPDDARGRHFRPRVVPAFVDEDLERAARLVVDLRNPFVRGRGREVMPAIGLQSRAERESEAIRRNPAFVEEAGRLHRRGLDDGGPIEVQHQPLRHRDVLELAALRLGRRGRTCAQGEHDRQQDEEPSHRGYPSSAVSYQPAPASAETAWPWRYLASAKVSARGWPFGGPREASSMPAMVERRESVGAAGGLA